MQLITVLSSVLAVAAAQAIVEPENFNLSEALLSHGVNVSALPQLGGLVERSQLDGCSIACASLAILFGPQVITQRNQAAFDGFTGSYWSAQQGSVDPYCIFKPANKEQVSIQVLISRLTQCPFAIKSGGHAAFAGASSIQGGITLSLEKLNQIVPSADKKTVDVGPGNRWHDVYASLQSKDIVVIGGRVSAIGVGGLTLGGGISFFSNIYGWACDNVISYEVVTAAGIIVEVSEQKFPDLYWALRGGGNNFAVVTNFKLRSIPLPGGRMWGGTRAFPSINPANGQDTGAFPKLIKAFVNIGTNGAISDPNAAQILSFTSYQGLNLAAAALQYAKPVANPPVFQEYLSIPGYLQDTTFIRTLTNLTDEFSASNPDGRRETYWVAAYKLTEAMTTKVKDIFYEELTSVANVPNIVPAATLQVITVPQLKAMKQRGGNPLGISESNGPLLLLNMNVQWDTPADDARIQAFNARIIQRTVDYAKQNGLYEDYLYMNYASQYQDVIGSYGEQNKQRLVSIAKTYDPRGVFQDLVPGGFKLDGAPATL